MSMRFRHHLPIVAFLLLAGAAGTGLYLTRGSQARPATKAVPRPAEHTVDLTPVTTANALGRLAASPEEEGFARDAKRLADHEVDLAFADALRRAADTPVPDTPEVKDLLARKARHQDALEEEGRSVARLEKSLATAPERDRDALEDQVEVAQAQMELDREERDAISERLGLLGADPAAKVRRLKEAFTAAGKAPAAEGADGAAPGSRFVPGSLLNRIDLWLGLRRKLRTLDAARSGALAYADHLDQRHAAKAKEVDQRRAAREAAHQEAKGFSSKGTAESREAAKATLLTLRRYMDNQRAFADLGRRSQDEKDLAEVYLAWRWSVADQERAALHGVVLKASWILVVLVLVFFSDRIFEAVFQRIMAGQGRVSRNLKVVKFTAQVLGALAIVIILLGTPGQLTTLLGLAGAGLTVALKDFIISFFGWFVLVGPRGIHVGDWVEINGVSGKVVEIGLMRTLLLETGNWTDAGHPTGRVVSFVNSFALEGHFFNFSSSGQWMWDELTVTVPAGEDPRGVLEGLRALVEERTRDNADQAFQEWERADRGYRVQGLKAEPSLSVLPTPAGAEIHVRYITCAQERNELRRDLNQAFIDLLHGKKDGPDPL
jgi:small-conductance mechanosensitive channel